VLYLESHGLVVYHCYWIKSNITKYAIWIKASFVHCLILKQIWIFKYLCNLNINGEIKNKRDKNVFIWSPLMRILKKTSL